MSPTDTERTYRDAGMLISFLKLICGDLGMSPTDIERTYRDAGMSISFSKLICGDLGMSSTDTAGTYPDAVMSPANTERTYRILYCAFNFCKGEGK